MSYSLSPHTFSQRGFKLATLQPHALDSLPIEPQLMLKLFVLSRLFLLRAARWPTQPKL